jgi:hypothetical protein
VTRQRQLIAGLKRDGVGNLQSAHVLLANFESLLELHKGHRDRIKRELEP